MPKLTKQGGLAGAMDDPGGGKPRAREGHGIDAGPILAAMGGNGTTVDLKTGAVKSAAERWVIAVDPGDVHCGMAEGVTHSNGQFEIVRAWEMGPDECADYVAGWLLSGELEALVVEKFNLYADKANEQIGSDFPTVQLIGVLRYLVRIYNQAAPEGQHATLAMYGADSKKSLRAQLKARGIALLPAEADHARDAQLHLWHWVGAEKMGWGQ